MKNYASLHNHSEFSLMDGVSKTAQLAKRAAELGMSAIALTDHGNLAGVPSFLEECHNTNVKPILGVEAYICNNGLATEKDQAHRSTCHQVLLAKNKEGWKDLLSLVSLANKNENYYYKPRIDWIQLSEYANRGNLISFSGHLGSHLAKIAHKNFDLAVEEAERLRDIFGKDHFFIEVQMIDSHINRAAKACGEQMREISRRTGISCIATGDAHYPERKDAEDQLILLSSNSKKSLKRIRESIAQGEDVSFKGFFQSSNYHIPSYEDFLSINTEEEIANTDLIAQMCDNYSILQSPQLPEFKCPAGYNPEQYLRYLCKEGWREKMGHITKSHPRFHEYGDRVNHELEVFCGANLSSYFLIVQDILKFAKSKGYLVGPGRGSAAGCMVSYLTGITQIDPIPHGLILERFYNPGRNTKDRISMPDIDIDVPKEARDPVIEYVINKYGKDNVAPIITFQTMKARNALTKVMTAYDTIPFDQQKGITKHIIEESKISDELEEMRELTGSSSVIRWCLENTPEKFSEWCSLNDEGEFEGPYASIFEQAIRLEGVKITTGKHPAGVVVSPVPISSMCPMVKDPKGGPPLAGFQDTACESVGLLKLDVLGITALSKVEDTVVDLNEVYYEFA